MSSNFEKWVKVRRGKDSNPEPLALTVNALPNEIAGRHPI